MKRLAVLISNAGTGTNLQAMINAIRDGRLTAQIVSVISDTEGAYGIVRAKNSGLPVKIIAKADDLLPYLLAVQPDYICLAGWKQLVLPGVVAVYKDRILNIHPGLVPDTNSGTVKNPDGTTGLWNQHKLAGKAIQNFLDRTATYGGSSLHFLTDEIDFGPVLGRCFEKIRPGDTVETFYARLKKKENKLYVKSLITLCK